MPRCRNSSSTVHAVTWLLAGALFAGHLSPAGVAREMAAAVDSREVYSQAAPAWLRAVGRLQVPGSVWRDGERAHLQENCSATLVAGDANQAADTIVTAWHCLENYNDLSKPILFTLPEGARGALQREAYRLADGGGMHADWALLRLRPPIAPGEATALRINPAQADQEQSISMAGYSRDEGKGDGGRRLTFDPVCRITLQAPLITSSDCLAHKGASGGAVVQLTAAGAPRYSGVVSQGDGSGVSTYIPVSAFRGDINRYVD